MKRIDLNVDVAEGFPFDAALLELATSANVCCGGHAGSRELALGTVAVCHVMGVRVGAHPGVPDPTSMGRGRWPESGLDALVAHLQDQVSFLSALGATYVKPHGTLYNASATRPDAAAVLARALKGRDLALMGLPGSLHETTAAAVGVRLIREGFADRRTASDGLLMDRSEPGAVITNIDEAVAHAVAVAKSVDSVCVHGDTPGCLELLCAVREALLAEGYEVMA